MGVSLDAVLSVIPTMPRGSAKTTGHGETMNAFGPVWVWDRGATGWWWQSTRGVSLGFQYLFHHLREWELLLSAQAATGSSGRR